MWLAFSGENQTLYDLDKRALVYLESHCVEYTFNSYLMQKNKPHSLSIYLRSRGNILSKPQLSTKLIRLLHFTYSNEHFPRKKKHNELQDKTTYSKANIIRYTTKNRQFKATQNA